MWILHMDRESHLGMSSCQNSCPPNRYSCYHGIRHMDMGRRSVCLSTQKVQLLSWHQTRGHDAAFCLSVNPTGTVAVMASATGTWGGFLSEFMGGT
ncbi:hypothetical protein AVEN_38115-1 [Araneus ventricosus]|uniref:Uncharacterized protein n=1 Tax=Araneus ventricosus TaxID=182803 RepID=A0A4Y2LJM7_ARAVE|nr:hypothetical protein AVEN_38115-1 [Araneus ventricosus]